jgi:epoxyqueuosine reductase QueG
MAIDAESMIMEMYEADTGNCFDDPSLGRLFDQPIVCVADARDPWFVRFKELIGDFYWTPQEALNLVSAGAEARSVISWCLPTSQIAREANAKETRLPARPWAYVRTFGEKFVTRLRHRLEDRLQELGYAALAPAVAPQNEVQEHPGVGLAACWSERHTAMVAGLGTFGISGGLITTRGIAHRLGSVVTDVALPHTPRPYGNDAFAWCLKASRGTCGTCIKRCPSGSIGPTVQERDKEVCRKYLSDVGQECKDIFDWEGSFGCGLCQTAVPCEDYNPTAGRG